MTDPDHPDGEIEPPHPDDEVVVVDRVGQMIDEVDVYHLYESCSAVVRAVYGHDTIAYGELGDVNLCGHCRLREIGDTDTFDAGPTRGYAAKLHEMSPDEVGP